MVAGPRERRRSVCHAPIQPERQFARANNHIAERYRRQAAFRRAAQRHAASECDRFPGDIGQRIIRYIGDPPVEIRRQAPRCGTGQGEQDFRTATDIANVFERQACHIHRPRQRIGAFRDIALQGKPAAKAAKVDRQIIGQHTVAGIYHRPVQPAVDQPRVDQRRSGGNPRDLG